MSICLTIGRGLQSSTVFVLYFGIFCACLLAVVRHKLLFDLQICIECSPAAGRCKAHRVCRHRQTVIQRSEDLESLFGVFQLINQTYHLVSRVRIKGFFRRMLDSVRQRTNLSLVRCCVGTATRGSRAGNFCVIFYRFSRHGYRFTTANDSQHGTATH